MSLIVRIPPQLRTLTAGTEEVAIEGAADVAALIEQLEAKHPGLRERLLDERGIRKFVNVYVGEDDVRFLDGLKTALKDGDQVSIVPAIAGGCAA
jgi:molybdopterin synthase sulfur carrier subunit